MTTATTTAGSATDAIIAFLQSTEYADTLPRDADIARRFGVTRQWTAMVRAGLGMPPVWELRCPKGHKYAETGTRPLAHHTLGRICAVCSPEPQLKELACVCDDCGVTFMRMGESRRQHIQIRKTQSNRKTVCPACRPMHNAERLRKWHRERRQAGD